MYSKNSFSNVIEDSEQELKIINYYSDLFINAKTIDEIKQLNIQFIKGEIYNTCYHYGPLNPESNEIHKELLEMNELGFITTCSQPGEKEDEYQQRGVVEGLIDKRVFERFRRIMYNTCDDIYIRKCDDTNLLNILRWFGRQPPEWFYVTINNGNPCTHTAQCDMPCESFRRCKLYEQLKEKFFEIDIIDMKWGRTNYIHNKVVEALRSL